MPGIVDEAVGIEGGLMQRRREPGKLAASSAGYSDVEAWSGDEEEQVTRAEQRVVAGDYEPSKAGEGEPGGWKLGPQ